MFAFVATKAKFSGALRPYHPNVPYKQGVPSAHQVPNRSIRGPATRVTCQGNQDSLRLVLARAVAGLTRQGKANPPKTKNREFT